ncbi:bis(5'-nucleosyl)-tetraphosphatase (symmetrical) YqeK [Muricomes sp. OA1]|uniref:bis(5'-nucleosyl)-tetraphosphatase (symmetrical) n=1 Tax=Hungatella hathewayi TaxID=154046 RepID=A0A3E2WXQ8_9FIRM|nr:MULTISPECIES: bis(5'-nucleosyl)-tetraphosphatase (symmetrical) YqeK [Clostridia]MCH1974081.1 bis(5'-nucleosyl)-tetraphosphatase (symmetrical) YqeK [Muricomes sp. OA1]RGC32332.1 HD domain-containing protein [Hungatella hathewayi]GKH32860.1 hydrolase [Faecalicatena contorta]
MTEILGIRRKLEKRLKPERYEHTLGVMYTAASLAMCYETDIHQAMLAGLLHDCGKFCSGKEQIKLCRDCNIALTESELKMPALIHAKLGAYLAEHEYNIKDSDILGAITYHTTGKPQMTLLEKIIFLADYIEPGRQGIPVLKEVRREAFSNLNKAVALSAGSTISYLKNVGREIDPMTVRTYEYYQ